MATTPIITQGKYGKVTQIGTGFAYADPRDNPNYHPPAAPNIPTTSTANGYNPTTPPITTTSATNIGNVRQTPIVTTPNPSTTNLGLTTNSAASQIATDATATPPTPPVNQAKTDNQSGLQSLIQKLTGQASDVTALQNDTKLYDKKQKAQALSTELDTMDKAFRDKVKAIQDAPGATTAGTASAIAKENETYQNNRANLALTYKVANEDYQGAEQIINDKVTALKDQNAQLLQAYQLQASLINNDLTESEKLQVASNYRIKEDQAKTTEDAYASALQAGQENNANAGFFNALDQAKQSGNPSDIYSVVSRYGYQTLDQKVKQAQLAKTRAEAAQLTGGDSTKADDLTAYANSYADTGTLPSPAELKLAGLSVGQVTQMAMQTPRQAGTLVSSTTGTKSPKVSSTQEDGISALYDLTKKLNDLSSLYTNSSYLYPGQTNQKYDVLRNEVVDLLARARSGAAINDTELKQYQDKLPPNKNVLTGSAILYPQTKIAGLRSSIEGKLKTALDVNGLSLYGYSKVKVGGTDRTVGEILNIGGQQYRVLPNGTLTDII